MTLQLGDTAPDFSASTTKGLRKFYEWAGAHGWCCFSYPRDFTPVCTTELGYVARLQPEFAKRTSRSSVEGLRSSATGQIKIEASKQFATR
jgi:alkyl hydroperoxide reductase subunit AhpC